MPPCEIIIVDDGNTSADAAEIARIAAQYGAQVIRHEHNAGAAVARNKGAAVAHGDTLFFADADAELEPHALKRLVAALMEKPDAIFAYGDLEFGSCLMRGKGFSIEHLREDNFISPMAVLRRDHFPGFDESLRRFQDWDLWLTVTQQGGVGVYVPTTVCRVVPGGTMSAWLPSFIAKNSRWFLWIPRVKKYHRAREIIKQKHHL